VFAVACGTSDVQGPGPSSPTPGATVTPAAGQPVVDTKIEDVAPQEVESLLSGDVLDRFRALPEDYQKALAAYLAFGVSPGLMPVLVEQKMAQWPEAPPPLRDLLGPERYESFKKLDVRTPAPRYAFFLLTFYVYVLNTEDTPEGQRQAVKGLMDAFGFTPKELEDAVGAETSRKERQAQGVPTPPVESILTPAALARLDQLGPRFQRAVRAFGGDDVGLQTLATMFTLVEVFLLKTPPGLELPPIEAYLSDQELADLRALPEDIRNTVEPRYHGTLVPWFMTIGIYPSVPIMTMPPEDVLSRKAKHALLFTKTFAPAGSGG
jgi:hypothetical protein